MKRITILLVAVTGASAQSLAADYPHRATLQARSSNVGLGKTEIPLLQRQSGPGSSTSGSQLLGRLMSHSGHAVTSTGNYTTRQDSAALVFQGDDGWTLKVKGDGTAAEYRNWRYRAKNMKAVAVRQQPTPATLAVWGRDFIKANLELSIAAVPAVEAIDHQVRGTSQVILVPTRNDKLNGTQAALVPAISMRGVLRSVSSPCE